MELTKRIAITETVVSKIKDMISSGSVGEGERLPDESDLARNLDVAGSTVREAILVLQALGHVEVRRGQGVFVISRQSGASEAAASWFADHVGQMSDYMETRQIFEAAAVGLAAERARNEELNEITNIHEALEKAVQEDDVVALVEADKAFHRAIVKAAHNRVLDLVNLNMEKGFEKYRIEGFAMKEARLNTLIPHRNILKFLQARDSAAAKEAMKQHLDITYRDFIPKDESG